MINRLLIRNLILIDTVTIPFGKGLNIISGETGSGKSAILSALNLIIGQRADSTLLRKGCDQGCVEAVFIVDALEEVKALLNEAGIACEGDEIILRRELTSSGKSRSFVNQHQVTNAFLKKMGEHLLGVIGQHANMQLLCSTFQRYAVDLFGGHLELVQEMQKRWKRERDLSKDIDVLKNSESQRIRELERSTHELEEIEQANVQKGEDDELFAEYTRLINAEEIAGSLFTITKNLSSGDAGVLQKLNHTLRSFEEAVRLDPSLESVKETFQSALIELQDVSFSLETHQEKHAFDPVRLEEINDRLTLINRLKRKYGDIECYQAQLYKKIEELENAETRIEELEQELQHLATENAQKALELTEKRKKSASLLEKALMKQLRQLNMPKVHFEIATQPHDRGDNHIEFLMAPNVGEHIVPVKECASGGELSRVMLALQTLLGGKEGVPTLLFDEIDANIGGETAVVVGEKLKDISSNHQVLCITHFPQVAKQADHHLRISKSENNGRTLTRVDLLDANGKADELSRMLGVTPTELSLV